MSDASQESAPLCDGHGTPPMPPAQTDLLGHPVREQMPVSEWLDGVAVFAGYDSGAEMVAITGACCWMEFYTDGLSPSEAWAEDCANA